MYSTSLWVSAVVIGCGGGGGTRSYVVTTKAGMTRVTDVRGGGVVRGRLKGSRTLEKSKAFEVVKDVWF